MLYKAQSDLAAQSASNGNQNVMIFLSDGNSNAPFTSFTGASLLSGTYPSVVNQCHQAVTAAAAATSAGTRVYSVSYGATSSGCSTDIYSAITACQAMQQIASAPQYLFSDYTATGGSSSCISASQPSTGLNSIFAQIASDLTVGRLIPDTTP